MARWKMGARATANIDSRTFSAEYYRESTAASLGPRGQGMGNSEGDGIMEQICDIVCVLRIPK